MIWKKLVIAGMAALMLGAGATMVAQASGRSPSSSSVVDISGPCDEAEHANDPRCNGTVGDRDNSGPGSGGDHEDRSGPSENSGPGNAHDDDDRGNDDNSGPGSGDDD